MVLCLVGYCRKIFYCSILNVFASHLKCVLKSLH